MATTIVLHTPVGLRIPVSLDSILQLDKVPSVLTPFLVKGDHSLDNNLWLNHGTNLSENWFVVLPRGSNGTVYDVFAIFARTTVKNWRNIRKLAERVYGESIFHLDGSSPDVFVENFCSSCNGVVNEVYSNRGE